MQMLIVPGIFFDPYAPAQARIQAVEVLLKLCGFQVLPPIACLRLGPPPAPTTINTPAAFLPPWSPLSVLHPGGCR